MNSVRGKRIAVIATNGFEQSELEKPVEALRKHGAVCEILSSQDGEIKGWKDSNWGTPIKVTGRLADASAQNFDALLIPGGALNCDKLRMDEDAVDLVTEFFHQLKPVAAICHGPQMLIEAGVVDGRTMTSYAAIRTDLENAGAEWLDEEVVVDQGLVTSRSPKDIPAFIDKMLEEFGEGLHEGQHA